MKTQYALVLALAFTLPGLLWCQSEPPTGMKGTYEKKFLVDLKTAKDSTDVFVDAAENFYVLHYRGAGLVEVFDKEGNLVKKFDWTVPNPTRNYKILVDEGGNILIYEQMIGSTLTLLDKDGKLISTFKDKHLQLDSKIGFSNGIVFGVGAGNLIFLTGTNQVLEQKVFLHDIDVAADKKEPKAIGQLDLPAAIGDHHFDSSYAVDRKGNLYAAYGTKFVGEGISAERKTELCEFDPSGQLITAVPCDYFMGEITDGFLNLDNGNVYYFPPFGDKDVIKVYRWDKIKE